MAALGSEAVERIVTTIPVYEDFCHDNDPCEEHDFGSFKAERPTFFFKINYYDNSFSAHSLNAANPTVTRRVITIMLAKKY